MELLGDLHHPAGSDGTHLCSQLAPEGLLEVVGARQELSLLVLVSTAAQAEVW
jgi:hypothetical protein